MGPGVGSIVWPCVAGVDSIVVLWLVQLRSWSGFKGGPSKQKYTVNAKMTCDQLSSYDVKWLGTAQQPIQRQKPTQMWSK